MYRENNCKVSAFITNFSIFPLLLSMGKLIFAKAKIGFGMTVRYLRVRRILKNADSGEDR